MLFTMSGCQICPQMERLFHSMHDNGAIEGLEVIDISQQPEMAAKYHVRSVPHYLINGIAFTGLKTRQQIQKLLVEQDKTWWRDTIASELKEGQLETVESSIRQNPAALRAMLFLLGEKDTTLVVRIGLTAVIESMAGQQLLNDYEQEFIALLANPDEAIVTDAMYYVSLLGTPAAIKALTNMAKHGAQNIRTHAAELLEEFSSEKRA